jgi:hypothetical protein
MDSLKKRFLLIGLPLLVLLLAVFLFRNEPATSPEPSGIAPATSSPETLPEGPEAKVEITTLPVAAEISVHFNSPDGTPEDDLDRIEQLLYFYRQGFGENPVGQNEDVVSALLGENPKQTAYLLSDCPAIVDGKLVDRWGSPYWFHPVSGKVMEVRSAGPDRDLFTSDDIQPVQFSRSSTP